ncbi:MAG: hypothetical protein GJ676_09625 [Rhodobacteraceae bacterium]|nr:hypothetical protein [Paracoccaceae bacterium]
MGTSGPRDAIIGHTGFVGGNLVAQHAFSGQFNSRNMDDSAGQRFGTVVCAAAPGSMFEANRFPDRDAAQIDALCGALARIKAERFVLISSIAVLESFDGQDVEGAERFQTDIAYGRNRRRLEEFCAETFARCLILRLPALFGEGLKKNFLFDLLNPMPTMLSADKMAVALDNLTTDLKDHLRAIYALNEANGMYVVDRAGLAAGGKRSELEQGLAGLNLTAVQFTHPDSRFQYYRLDRLWADVETAYEHDLDVLHLATEPLLAARIHEAVTGRTMPETAARVHREDMHSRHAELWGRTGPYLESADQVLDRLAGFARAQRRAS